ncbi:MAG: hypothetical protein KC731_26960, partial [Myxococcales bacterium]|nr:hypothetical protein [Myxococcales bacterium]
RDYDAVTGRWMAKDPILFAGGQADLYLYVDGDVVNLRDVTGRGPVGFGKCLVNPNKTLDECFAEEERLCDGPLGNFLCGDRAGAAYRENYREFPDFSECLEKATTNALLRCCAEKCEYDMDGELTCPGTWSGPCFDACVGWFDD